VVNALDPATDDSDQVEEEFRSLLEGLRTTLPGVQLVTAFLLTVPLYDKYDQLGTVERVAYYIAFASALVASVLLTAPSSHQRLRARRRRRPAAPAPPRRGRAPHRHRLGAVRVALTAARTCVDHRGRTSGRARRHRGVASRWGGAGTTCRCVSFRRDCSGQPVP
jgi:hypothetical protein